MFEVRIQPQAFDVGEEQARLASLGPEVGAVMSFTGLVRDQTLSIEHYPAMAKRQAMALVDEARSRWPLLGAIVIHRFGTLTVGEPIVLVLTASAHRHPAIEAGTFLIDWLKTKAPFWKQEAGVWVEARASDEEAAARWER